MRTKLYEASLRKALDEEKQLHIRCGPSKSSILFHMLANQGQGTGQRGLPLVLLPNVEIHVLMASAREVSLSHLC